MRQSEKPPRPERLCLFYRDAGAVLEAVRYVFRGCARFFFTRQGPLPSPCGLGFSARSAATDLKSRALPGQKALGLACRPTYQTASEALIIDDIGYVEQSREEMEVLFVLLAQRYERGSVMLTSNLSFSQWEHIFKNPMTTAAAIDRLVHHSVILELNLPSYRLEVSNEQRTIEKSVSRTGVSTRKAQ